MAKYQNKYAIPASAKNRPIWACAYDVDNDTGRSRLKQLPAKGIIQKDGRHETFYLLKKDGTPRANGVNASARCYADTYEECVEIYNDLVNERIKLLQNLLQETKEDYFVPKPL